MATYFNSDGIHTNGSALFQESSITLSPPTTYGSYTLPGTGSMSKGSIILYTLTPSATYDSPYWFKFLATGGKFVFGCCFYTFSTTYDEEYDEEYTEYGYKRIGALGTEIVVQQPSYNPSYPIKLMLWRLE